MKINESIVQSLELQNQAYHEASECVQCKPKLSVKGGTWTTLSDMANYSHGSAGLVHYFDGENVLLLPFAHELVIGSTGSGKSEVFYKNQLDILPNLPERLCPSILVTDTKGSLHASVLPKLKKMGYRIVVLDMRNPYQSARYNPLLQIYDNYHAYLEIKDLLENDNLGCSFDAIRYSSKKQAKAAAEVKAATLFSSLERQIAEISFIIVPETEGKEKLWSEGARTMCRALIWTMLRDSEDPRNGMTRQHFTLSNLCNVAYSTDDDCQMLVEWLEGAKDILYVKSAITSNYKLSAKVTRDGFISTLNTSLGPYSSRAIGAITATSDDIKFQEIAMGNHPYAIFIITDERQKATNAICSIFINSLIDVLVMEADSRPNNSLSRDFVILADEFANIPPLPDLSQKITTLRSRKIWLVMAIQSIQQLKAVYGDNITSIVIDNCDLQLFLGSNNDETKESFANSMGKRIGVKTSFSVNNDGNISMNKITESVPLVRKSDLDGLDIGQFYLKSRCSPNLKSYIIPYFKRNDTLLSPCQESLKFHTYDPGQYRYDIDEIIRMKHRDLFQTKKYDWDF